jgi:hypothetical protein
VGARGLPGRGKCPCCRQWCLPYHRNDHDCIGAIAENLGLAWDDALAVYHEVREDQVNERRAKRQRKATP